jgi:hypothetical protein
MSTPTPLGRRAQGHIRPVGRAGQAITALELSRGLRALPVLVGLLLTRGPAAVAQGTPDSAGAPAPVRATPEAVTALAPVDTTLARACNGAPGGTEAPGLLAVVFRSRTPDTARVAAARAVGGTLAGPTGYGEEYVRVPPNAGPLTVVADRLIRQRPVTQVSPVPCPPPPPAPAQSGDSIIPAAR